MIRWMLAVSFSIPLLAEGAPAPSEVRMATILDMKGREVLVKDLQASREFEHNGVKDVPPNVLLVYSDTLKVCVPLAALVSLERTPRKGRRHPVGHVYSATYLVEGRKETIHGGLHNPGSGVPTLSGKAMVQDLEGTYQGQVYDVRRLAFPEASARPISLGADRSGGAILEFLDGKKLAVWHLHTYSYRYSTDGYLVGGRTLHAFGTSYGVGIGPARAVLPFKEIRRIVFDPQKPAAFANYLATVTSVKGASYPSESTGRSVFSGEYEGGRFVVDSEVLRSVEFLP